MRCFKKKYPLFYICALAFSSLFAEDNAEEQGKQLRPTHFARDVMQPIGTPFISSFHHIRESTFLNTHRKKATGLEGIGDFFLVPSRYLFAGKTIEFKEEEGSYEIRQSFHYRKMHWLKTTLALIALPVSELLGSTLKGLAYLSKKTRDKRRKVHSALRSETQSNLEKYAKIGIEKIHSEEYIPCLHHKRPSKLSAKQKAEITALKDITQALDEQGIIYWIDFGTCLGAYRYGGIIPWDWDIDLSILLPDHENVKKALSRLDQKKYQLQDWSSYSNPKTFLKLFVKETKNFIDITHYQLDEVNQKTSYFFTYLESPFPQSWKQDEIKGMKPVGFDTLFPLKKANFDGLTVWAPNDVVCYLESKYNGNLEPSNVWDEETQRYRKVEDHPYWAQ
ncbi:MAG: LicD family protein [Chlamydiales bacterium]|nr:LicD family protein [Chlamydiales bacterium]